MNCLQIKEKLSAYIDGELSQKEMELVHNHLEKCNECAVELEKLEKIAIKVSDYFELKHKSVNLDRLYDDVMFSIEKNEKVDFIEATKENFISNFFKNLLKFSPAFVSLAAIILISFAVLNKSEVVQDKQTTENVTVDSLEYSKFNAMIYKTKEKNKAVIWLFKQEEDSEFDDPI